MKRLTALLLIALCPGVALAAPPPGFAEKADAVRAQAGVPGMAIAIVENGKATMVRGFGHRRVGGGTVDVHTIFPTGSTGKAFTTAALATLVDAGRISWDDKVIDHLPYFRMYDHWVTGEMTIRDLLVHRSGLGLGQGDLLFVPRGKVSRAELVRRLRYLKPATSFRSGYAYDNVLYAVAGQLVEAVSGQPWEDYVRDHVLQPAAMIDSTTDNDRRFRIANRAYPHARTQQPVRGLGPLSRLDERDELGRAAAPAGGLAISASDMAKWLRLQLAHGKLPDGTRLFSEAQHEAMWTPEVIQPIAPVSPALQLTRPNFDTYALGWEVRDYRGAKVVWHAGGVLGFQSIVVLLPEKDVGFSVEINSEDSEVLFGLMYDLLDHYLDLPSADWPARFAADYKARREKAAVALAQEQAKPADAGPSLPLQRYAGLYHDDWYGDIRIEQGDGGLSIDFLSTPRMQGRLEHWQYDSFVTRFTDQTIEPAYVTFALDADGKVERITLKAVSPLADFSFDYHDLLFRPVPQDADQETGRAPD
ncbi:serine hydrolase [Novosphingobium profundi]|uniref:serine hydrolase n=1 Tax=Novosphingobium profundi TaxID=1774954 RepID=UPI001CFC665C|nr:serine hydrolase [Novosphingobium profundi]